MERFTQASETAQEGGELVSDWAAEQDLERADEPEHDSVRWGLNPETPILWLFPTGEDPGLELWLGDLPGDVSAPLSIDFSRFDAVEDEAPRIPWDVLVERWDELRDGPLADYVTAWQENPPDSA